MFWFIEITRCLAPVSLLSRTLLRNEGLFCNGLGLLAIGYVAFVGQQM